MRFAIIICLLNLLKCIRDSDSFLFHGKSCVRRFSRVKSSPPPFAPRSISSFDSPTFSLKQSAIEVSPPPSSNNIHSSGMDDDDISLPIDMQIRSIVDELIACSMAEQTMQHEQKGMEWRALKKRPSLSELSSRLLPDNGHLFTIPGVYDLVMQNRIMQISHKTSSTA